jgi:hypothetical protein
LFDFVLAFLFVRLLRSPVTAEPSLCINSFNFPVFEAHPHSPHGLFKSLLTVTAALKMFGDGRAKVAGEF